MPAPSAFQGSRAVFLKDAVAEYAAGVEGGYVKDAIAIIQCRYFKHYPIDLPHNVEPSEEYLKSITEDEPDEEPQPPNPEVLEDDEYLTQLAAYEDRQRLIIFRKAQIQRRLAYLHGRTHDMDPKETGEASAHRVLLHKLTGYGVKKPRMKTASNVWRRSHRVAIEAEAKRRAGTLQGKELRKKLASLREKVSKEMYTLLGEEEKTEWKKLAEDEHAAALLEYQRVLNSPPSEKPEDRQRVIQELTQFAQPILDLICEATGWKASLIAGGPEPADQGRLNIVSIHSGTTVGPVKMSFGRSEQERYKKHFIPMFHTFLKKCYNLDECRQRALPDALGFESLESIMRDEGNSASVHRGERPMALAASPISQSRSRSHTPAVSQTRSRSRTPAVSQTRSRSRTPAVSQSRSRSRTPALSESRSRSHTPALSEPRSRSPTPISQSRSRSPTPAFSEPRSRSPTPISQSRSRSPTPAFSEPRSRSPTPISQSRSRSHIPNHELPRLSQNPSCKPTTRASRAMPPSQPRPQTQVSLPPTLPVPPATKSVAKRRSAGLEENSEEEGSAGNPRKKQKMAKEDVVKQMPVLAAAPPDAPPPPVWFTRSFLYFSEGSSAIKLKPMAAFGADWHDLLKEWTLFQNREGYTSEGRLPAKYRPAVISEWIKNARSEKWVPKAGPASHYRKAYESWWVSLQPKWRLENGRVLEERVVGNWGDLKTPGINGVLSLVAALFFWGVIAHENPEEFTSWRSAVKSCLSVLRAM